MAVNSRARVDRAISNKEPSDAKPNTTSVHEVVHVPRAVASHFVGCFRAARPARRPRQSAAGAERSARPARPAGNLERQPAEPEQYTAAHDSVGQTTIRRAYPILRTTSRAACSGKRSHWEM